MTPYDVVKKLIGPIEATGEHNSDQRRLHNLETAISVSSMLFVDIYTAARDKDSEEASVKKIGQRADEYLAELHAELTECREG